MSADVLEITQFEEHIYNTHLRISKTHQKQPYKYRKDFSSLDDKTKILLKKISTFIKKYDHIKVEEFIAAPYSVYKDEQYFPLDYYISLKATKAFSLFQKNKLYEDPDSEYHIKNIVDSLTFIQQFCKTNKLKLSTYLDYTSEQLPYFVLHLKEHRVNLYTLLGFSDFVKKIRQVEPELLKFVIGEETYNRIDICKTKLLNSEKALTLVTKGLKIVQKKLEENS